eukprot:66382_1
MATFRDDDSKTLEEDGSVLVHDLGSLDSVPDSIQITQSVPDKTADTLITPQSKIGGTAEHGRNLSLSNTIPTRYLTHAASLIKLLDGARQTSQRNLGVPTQRNMAISKSAPIPDQEDGDLSRELSPSLHSENEFNIPLNKESNGHLYDSEDNVVGHGAKQAEYEQLIASPQNKDDIVDMHLLAAKAAEEFKALAHDNDRLRRDNDRMKEEHDDMMHDREVMMEQMTHLKLGQQASNTIANDIDLLRSKASKWELEKKLLMAQLSEYQDKPQNGKGGAESPQSGRLVGKTGLKLKNRQSEDAERLMKVSLAKLTKEKNELEDVVFKEKQTKREYELLVADLKKELADTSAERERLNASLDKQQQLYYSLRENAKKKEQQIDDIVGIARKETLQEEVEAEKEKLELLEAVEEHKAYIEELEAENQRLMTTKVKDDDRMFDQLNALRSHRFQPSMQFGTDAMPFFNAPSDAGTHSRAHSQSFSAYSQSGLFFATTQSNGELIAKTARTQINLFSADDFGALPDEHDDERPTIEDAAPDMDTPQPTQKEVKFKVMKAEGKETHKKKKEEIRRINAEIEFFLLTCIAVKANLVEEYPDKPEVITEDPMQLFQDAQTEHVVMSKFNLWIELRLREKYALPKLEGFHKVMEKYDVKGKMSKLGKEVGKVGTASKKLASAAGKKIGQGAGRVRAWSTTKKKTNDSANGTSEEEDQVETIEEEMTKGNTDKGEEQKKDWGEIIRRKTGEFGTRIRGLSTKKNETTEENATGDETKGIAEEETEEKEGDPDKMESLFQIDETNKDTKEDANAQGNDNAPNNNNKLCGCIVM